MQFVQPEEADVIASHISIPHEYVRRFPDKPFVAHCHGLYWSDYPWEAWAYRANREVLDAIALADQVTAPSEWVARIIARHTSRRVHVIPHGVSGTDWTLSKENKGYVLWNKTRIDPICTPEFVDSVAELMPAVPFVTTFGKQQENVIVTGRLPYEQGKEVIQQAGVYLATTRETFGIGTLEAMACGVPVVGFDYGGQSEFIEHGKDGWLVEPYDVRGLAEGIRWALDHRVECGLAAREKAMQFPWARAAQMYHDVYMTAFKSSSHHERGPRTSIIITAYNLADYLPDAIDSVLAQTDDSYECIIVNDASTDSTAEIADRYAREYKNIRVIHNEENVYLAEARNIGIRAARGRYILPLDADDMLAPRAVETLADALDADRTLHIAYGGVLFVDEDGKTPTNYGYRDLAPGHSDWPMVFDAERQVMGANLLPYASMYRRGMWEDLAGYRRRLKTAEDADFWTRAASFGYKAERVTTQDMLVYRNREGSMSRTHREQRLNYLRWYPWARDPVSGPAAFSGDRSVALLTPRVAVVIPCGPGHERYVIDAVDSVQAQSYRLWECIVVNDSGAPLTLPSWVRVIDVDVRDAGAARNAGIANASASAKLFLPLDADDILQPDALQWLTTAYVEANEECIIYSDFYEDPKDEGAFSPYALDDPSCTHLTQRGALHAVTALTPKSVWEKVGGYAEGQNWEDWDFQLRCAEAGICSYHIQVPLFTYRKWTGRRRDYDDEEFEQRKTTILARWKDYFEGRKQLMACGCSSKARVPSAPQLTQRARAERTAPPGADAQLVEYRGARMGSVRYRGPSGVIYAFSRGEQRWVQAQDLKLFLDRKDFVVSSPEAQAKELTPVLMP